MSATYPNVHHYCIIMIPILACPGQEVCQRVWWKDNFFIVKEVRVIAFINGSRYQNKCDWSNLPNECMQTKSTDKLALNVEVSQYIKEVKKA